MDAIEALYEVEPQSANKQNVRYLKGTYFDTRRAVLVSLKLSECLNQLKSFHKSDSILRNALILSNNYNDRDLSFKVKEAQSLFYEISKDFVKAIYLRNEICKDYIKIKATTKALTQCEYIGDLCVRIKDYDQAIEFYEKALTIFDGRQHPDKVIVFSKKIKATKKLKNSRKNTESIQIDSTISKSGSEEIITTSDSTWITSEPEMTLETQPVNKSEVIESIELKKKSDEKLYEEARKKYDCNAAYKISKRITAYDSLLITYESENTPSKFSDFKMNLLKLRYDKMELERLSRERLIEKEKRDYINKISVQEQETKRIVDKYLSTILLMIIAILILAFVIYKKRKDAESRFKLNIAKIEMKALRAQMNPHFIFNALQSIQTFLIQHKDDEANTYLIKFFKIVRKMVLENSQHAEITLENEIATLKLYMALESIRLKFPFTYDFQIESAINIESDLIPPLILQPIVDIVSGMVCNTKNDPGHIMIKMLLEQGSMVIIVEDNGIGRSGQKNWNNPLMENKESLGTKLTAERLKILNETHGTPTSFKIEDLYDIDGRPTGTKAILKLPHFPEWKLEM
ncbi:MAG: histidine kinase [Bacteroidetes bacterium]|nr:histidine kinase [Bacteroidota bacterium]